MTFTYPAEEYFALIEAYKKLENPVFSPGDSDEKILNELEARSRRKKEIADKVNLFISEYIETFERSPSLLTGSDASKLNDFLDKLYPPSEPLGPDAAISLRIAAILRDHYKSTGDTDGYVSALKKCAGLYVNLFAYHGMRAYTVSPYRDECIELVKRVKDLSEKSAYNALRALSLSIFVQHNIDFDVLWLTDDLIMSAVGNTENLSDEYDLLVLATSHNIMSMFCRDLELKAEAGIKVRKVTERERLTRMCRFCNEHREKGKLYGNDPSMFGSVILRTRFFLGEISVQEFLDSIDELLNAGENNPDPAANVYFISQLNNTYINYLKWFSGRPEEEIRSITRERVYKRLPRMLSATRRIESNKFNLYMLLFLQGAAATGSFEDFEKTALEMTVYADKALYIHTEMVREISLAIFDHLIEKTPEVFDGTAGRGTAYIRAHKDEMRMLLSKCCMFHDVGKFFMLDIVENSMRRLTNEEFDIIKSHPANFDEIVPYELTVNDENLRCIRDCAMTHHLWHDGSRGYPVTEQTKNRPFADIIAIADGLDAATDVYGRPYRKCKTLDELISEFRSGAGDHYGSEAAFALSDPEVYKKLQYLITEGRKKTYCRIYRQKKPNADEE